MYRKIILSLVLPFCLLTILFSVIAETAVHALNVSGPITTDTTWTVANSPYTLTSNVTIEPGVHLTIEANVDVLFAQGATLNVNGHLQVEGTESNPVKFRPVATTPAFSPYAFDISETGSVSMQHGIVSDLGLFPIYVHGTGNEDVVIENSLITYEENYSVIVDADALHRLRMNNVTFDGQNTKNVLISFNLGSILLTDDVILKPQPGLDGYLINESGGIPEGITMTLEAGTTMLFSEENALEKFAINGHLQVNGTVTNPVTVTTIADTETVYLEINETGSVMMTHGIIKDMGRIPGVNYPDFPIEIKGAGNKQIVLENSLISNEEDYAVVIGADGLHRLQMNNVTFDGQNAKNVIISFNNLGPISLSDDVILKPQPGLDGYLINESGSIPTGITMTLEAGMKMLFTAPNNSPEIFEINGHLQVNGTTANPVTLTKVAETDTYWIDIKETGSVMMKHGVIDDMGQPPNLPYPDFPMLITGASDNQIVFEDSLISSDDDYYVIVEADALHRLKMDNLTFAGSGHKQIFVEFGGFSFPLITMTESVELWPQPGLDAYWFAEDVRIPENLTMILRAGVNIQLAEPSQLQVEGQLISEGTAQNPVKISKSVMHDESSYWNGIQVKGGDVQLNHTMIQDALVGVQAESGTVEIENSQIISSTQVGMLIEGGTVTAVCTQFRNNQTAGIQVPESASPTTSISQSVFEGNGVSVWNLGDTAVSAINNWWGSTAGPQIGTDVIGDVTIEPWLLWEPECVSDSPVYETYLPLVIRP